MATVIRRTSSTGMPNGINRRMKRFLSLWPLALIVGLFVAGCGGPERTISKEEEKKWRTPPKEPPPEFKGNMMGTPGAPPAGANKGAGG